MKKSKIIILLTILLYIPLLISNPLYAEESKTSVVLYLFWSYGCPHCAKEKEFLSAIKKKYPKLEIKDYEVSSNPASRELLITMSKSYGINPSGVPVTFVGDRGIVGFNEEVANQIEQTIKSCIKKICQDPLFYKKY